MDDIGYILGIAPYYIVGFLLSGWVYSLIFCG